MIQTKKQTFINGSVYHKELFVFDIWFFRDKESPWSKGFRGSSHKHMVLGSQKHSKGTQITKNNRINRTLPSNPFMVLGENFRSVTVDIKICLRKITEVFCLKETP